MNSRALKGKTLPKISVLPYYHPPLPLLSASAHHQAMHRISQPAVVAAAAAVQMVTQLV